MTVMYPGHPAYEKCMRDAKRAVPMNKAGRKNFVPLDVQHARDAIRITQDYSFLGDTKGDAKFIERMEDFIRSHGQRP